MSVNQLSSGGSGGGGDGVIDLSTKENHPPQKCEVKVDIKEDGSWIRIPVTLCELWINKDGPADVTRTAKVKFPAEWNGNDITQYINGFNAQTDESAYDEARIWFYDESGEGYQIAHYGYVGSVGPATENGVMKLWVYDPADLMRGIQVSKTFGNPTIQQILDFVLRGTDENGRGVGLEHRSVFSDIRTYISGVQEVRQQKRDLYAFGTGDGDSEEDDDEFQLGDLVGPLQFDDFIDDVADALFGTEQTGSIFSQKRFQLNRHNMVDLMNWFAGEIGGKWQFEPTPSGPVLFFDNTSSEGIEQDDGDFTRRIFVDDELHDPDAETFQFDGEVRTDDISDFNDRDVFDTVDVLDNDALYDIKPFNTLYLYGESRSATDYRNDYGAAGAPSILGEEFPYVKIQYQPLLDRAGGYEYTTTPIESDAVFLSQAEKQAKTEFRKHLEESTEGTIMIRGEPHILPYDYIRTIPTCNDTYTNVEEVPITYEVNGVKHRRAADERYETEIGVSLTFDESMLEIESEYKQG